LIRGILFDLDGTLLDTAPDLIGALNHVRKQEGLPVVSVADYRHLVSRGAAGLVGQGMPEADPASFERRKSEFLKHYAEFLFQDSVFFDGVEDVLAVLERNAIPWGVVTNKMESLTLPLLQAAGLLNRAAGVVCGDTLNQSKPHPAPILLGCEMLNCPNSQTLMVGDDLRDLEAGQAAGTLTALALYGYLEPGIFSNDLSGSYQIERPIDVLQLLELDECRV